MSGIKKIDRDPIKRFMRFVKKNRQGCWLWQSTTLPYTGYGTFSFEGKKVSAHRWSYTTFVGAIPKGYDVMHSCDIPGCVRPCHLSVGTRTDNMEDSAKKGRTNTRKLTVSQVINIRSRYTRGGTTYKTLSQKYGVTPGHIGHIIRRRTWKFI